MEGEPNSEEMRAKLWLDANAEKPGNLLLGSYEYNFGKGAGKYLPPGYSTVVRPFEAEIIRNPRLQKKRNAARRAVQRLVGWKLTPGMKNAEKEAVWFDAIGRVRLAYGKDPEVENILRTGREVLKPNNTGTQKYVTNNDYELKYYKVPELEDIFKFRNESLADYVKKGGTRKRRSQKRKTRRYRRRN